MSASLHLILTLDVHSYILVWYCHAEWWVSRYRGSASGSRTLRQGTHWPLRWSNRPYCNQLSLTGLHIIRQLHQLFISSLANMYISFCLNWKQMEAASLALSKGKKKNLILSAPPKCKNNKLWFYRSYMLHYFLAGCSIFLECCLVVVNTRQPVQQHVFLYG